MITVAAALTIATGATALQSSPAEAGVTIQLVHGSGHRFGPVWGYWFGPRWRHHGYAHAHRGPRFGRGVYYGRKFRRGAQRPSVNLNFDSRDGGRSGRNGGRNNNRR